MQARVVTRIWRGGRRSLLSCRPFIFYRVGGVFLWVDSTDFCDLWRKSSHVWDEMREKRFFGLDVVSLRCLHFYSFFAGSVVLPSSWLETVAGVIFFKQQRAATFENGASCFKLFYHPFFFFCRYCDTDMLNVHRQMLCGPKTSCAMIR